MGEGGKNHLFNSIDGSTDSDFGVPPTNDVHVDALVLDEEGEQRGRYRVPVLNV